MRWFGSPPSPPPAAGLPSDRRELGMLGEEIAAAFLVARGFRVLARNFRCKGGEVDIVARAPGDRSLVFVEVKARRSLTYGPPQLAVTPFKQHQIVKAAQTWLVRNHQGDAPARFDVIAIVLDAGGRHAVEHIVNAFETPQ